MKVAVTINRNVLDSKTLLPREWKPEMRENVETLLLIPVIRFIGTLLNVSSPIEVNSAATFCESCNRFNAKWVTETSHLNHNSSSCDFSNLRREREEEKHNSC